MLLDLPRSQERSVLPLLDNDGQRLFLIALLESWNFQIVAAPQDASLVLASDGVALPPNAPECLVRLSRAGYSGSGVLPLPVAVGDLWSSLEHCFHRPPRNHLRLTLEIPAQATVRGTPQVVNLLSLSDAGARLMLQRELAGGETLPLAFELDGNDYSFESRVIYSFATTGAQGLPCYNTGVIFAPGKRWQQLRLRDQIIARYLAGVRRTLPTWAWEVGLTYLDLSPAVLDLLESP